MKRSQEKNRWLILAGGVAQYLCLGLMYSWSAFSDQIRQSLGFTQGGVTLAYSVSITVFTLGLLLDGVLSRFLRPGNCALLGAALAAAGYFAASLVTERLPWLLYVSYGLGVGLGFGLVYNVWLDHIVKCFPDRSGFATGLLLLGMGLSGITVTPLMALVARALGWRWSFRCIGGLMLFLAAVLYPALRPPKAESGQQQEESGFTAAGMMATACFWAFALWKLILLGLGQASSGQVVQILADAGSSEELRLAALSLFMAVNGFARLLWGRCADRLGRNRTVCLVTAACALGTALLAFGGSDPLAAAFALLLIALSYGGATLMGAQYVAAVFGRKHYRINNGISAATSVPASLGATALIGLARDAWGSYLPFYAAALAAVLVAFALAFAASRLEKKL